MDSASEQRAGRNQALFRETNEAIEQGLWPGEEHGLVRFRCECARLDCHHVVEVSLEEYERVRANPRTFLVAVGHELTEIERTVRRRPGYLVVEKDGAGARQAEDQDPRVEA